MEDPLRAVLYAHDPVRVAELVDRLTAGADLQGWPVAHVTQSWAGVVQTLAGGEADIGLMTSWDDLDPLRVPRLVSLDELVLPPAGRRRPTIRRPDRGAPRRRRA